MAGYTRRENIIGTFLSERAAVVRLFSMGATASAVKRSRYPTGERISSRRCNGIIMHIPASQYVRTYVYARREPISYVFENGFRNPLLDVRYI